jgi:hypothetical protein
MDTTHLLRRLFLTAALLGLLGTAAACGDLDSLPRAWIDSPGNGARLTPGEAVTVHSHVYAREGVVEVMLSVNGTAYRRDAPLEPGESFSEARQDWLPEGPGTYNLQVQAFDANGLVSIPDLITVHIGAEPEAPVEAPAEVATTVVPDTPTSTQTGTLEPPTETPTPTITNTATLTVTHPVTQTPTQTPTWTFTSPPPTDTPTPTEVPPDTTAPPIPVPAAPANGAVLPCTSTATLSWSGVSDPSGIAGYYVKLEKQVTVDNWQSAGGWGPLSGTSQDVSINCGLIYRWMVRSEDGAGNYSGWSSPSQFSINLE